MSKSHSKLPAVLVAAAALLMPLTGPAGAQKPPVAAPGAGPAATPAPGPMPGAPLPAPAASPPAPAPAGAAGPASAEARTAARELMELTGAGAMMGQVLDGMRPLLIQALRQQSPQVPAATVERAVDEVLLPEFRARLPEAQEQTAELYVQHFTAAELRELAAFYRSPIGRKTLQAMPQLLQQSMAVGQAWGQRVAAEAIAKNRDALRGRGITL